MRSRPVIPVIGRRVMVPWQLGEYGVEADTPVLMSILLVHHREDVYPDPFAFRPERFLNRKPGTYEWIPFGGGIRRCLGPRSRWPSSASYWRRSRGARTWWPTTRRPSAPCIAT